MLLVVALAAAECTAPRLTAELETALDGAERAWGVDADTFAASADAALAILPCVQTILAHATAARLHRIGGLRAWAARDPDRAHASFAAARAIEPDYRFPETMVPAGNPVETLYDSARPNVATTPLPPVKKGRRVWLDGDDAPLRDPSRPVVWQLQEGEHVRQTSWVAPNDPLPRAPHPRDGTRGPLLVGAGAAALAAVGAYAGALVAHDAALAGPSLPEVREGQAAANALVVTSAGLGAVAAGLGASAFVVGRW